MTPPLSITFDCRSELLLAAALVRVPHAAEPTLFDQAKDVRPWGPVPASLVVHQTSSRLLIELKTETSKSCSTMAARNSEPSASNGLRYAFANMPRTLSKKTMLPHGGMVQLTLSADGSHLSGDYETDRFRNTTGRLEFHRTATASSSGKPKEEPRAHT